MFKKVSELVYLVCRCNNWGLHEQYTASQADVHETSVGQNACSEISNWFLRVWKRFVSPLKALSHIKGSGLVDSTNASYVHFKACALWKGEPCRKLSTKLAGQRDIFVTLFRRHV